MGEPRTASRGVGFLLLPSLLFRKAEKSALLVSNLSVYDSKDVGTFMLL